ncbi:MAG: T9SS type A sorting domain-containing protein, partial [Saprospiraceae bacterium]|nr:T9SS type A sorting domain-containing protein [Saprospiraceae bacterium]
ITTASTDIPFPGSTALYPNPAREAVTVMFDLLRNADVQVTVSNHLGQVIRATTIRARQGHSSHQISLSDLPGGMYFISLAADGASETHRLVKQ